MLKENFTEHSEMRIECATSRQTAPVHNVKFSHRSIKRRFDDGRPLADLVEQLRRDEVHPLRDSFYVFECGMFEEISSAETIVGYIA